MSEHYDIAVLGTGPGGYIAALKAAQMGAKVAAVEAHLLGGTCLNYGCIPSKALLASAELLHTIRDAKSWGVQVSGEVGFDWKAIQKRKDRVVGGLRGGVKNLFAKRDVALYEGKAVIDAPGQVAVTADGKPAERLTADSVILATGSSPSRISGWPTDPEQVCTSDEALHWKELPKRLLIVGGGVIGCEFACMLRQYDVEVTVVEMLPRLLPNLDAELGAQLEKIFKKRKIACHVNTKVEDLSVKGETITAVLEGGKKVKIDKVLVATGRRPNTDGVGLDHLGVETERGFVRVDEGMRTGARGVYCIGDANGRCLLAHAAGDHGVVAVENALGRDRRVSRAVPWCVYTFPEIAGVGMTQEEAERDDLPISVGRFPIGHLGKAMAAGHTDGFVKVIRHRETDALLGVHMLGHNVTEVIASAAAMLGEEAKVTDVAETVFAHPTISEALKEAAEDALGAALHLPPRKMIRVTAEA